MPISNTPKKDHMVRALLDPTTHAQFDALMKKKGESQSGFVRRLIIDAIETDQGMQMSVEKTLKEIIARDANGQHGQQSWSPQIGTLLGRRA